MSGVSQGSCVSDAAAGFHTCALIKCHYRVNVEVKLSFLFPADTLSFLHKEKK